MCRIFITSDFLCNQMNWEAHHHNSDQQQKKDEKSSQKPETMTHNNSILKKHWKPFITQKPTKIIALQGIFTDIYLYWKQI